MTNHTNGSIIERYIIIWLDSDINNANTNHSFDIIRHIIHSIKILHNIGECINFLNTIKKGKIFLIITDSFIQQHNSLISVIEQTIQINSVYIFSNDLSQGNHWQNDCRKFRGIFNQIESICNSIEEIICRCENNSRSNSIISPKEEIDFDDLDQSYIYSKLLLSILLKINYDDKSKKESFDFCREYYADNNTILKQIDEFEENYSKHSPIWWYTKETTPIRTLLKDALITQDIDMMIKMGFFIRDLHFEIRKHYLKTYSTNKKFIVYRGQGMLKNEFEEFIQRKGSLYVFHNFISTSIDKAVAFYFAKCATVDSNCQGILFEMEIDPTICTIPYASLDNISYYNAAENEILFSTHTIFRIDDIIKTEDDIWKVNLTLTQNTDEQLISLTHQIGYEIESVTNWHSLARFLYLIGKYSKAIEIFNKIIERIDDNKKEESMILLTSSYNNFGLMYDSMGDYSQALERYDKALEIQEVSLPLDHPSLATVYNNIGMTYLSLGDYTRAFPYCEKSLEIRLKSSSDHRSLITIYSNIGKVYEAKGDYLNALSNYERAFEIQQSFLPSNHPSFTLSYNNFGGIYSLMGNYSKALLFYEKTFKIQEKSLPLGHSSLATTYNNIGYVYYLMGNYNRSLIYYKHALTIQQKPTFSNQLLLAITYNNLGLVYRFMGDYSMACSYYEKALKIEEDYLESDNPSLASTYNNLGAIQQVKGEYSNALSYYKKALDIWQQSLPSNHSSLATIYNNIGSVHDSLKDYKQALSYYEKTLEIQQNLSSINQLDQASTYNNIGEAHRAMGDYTTALSYYQKTLEIERKFLSTNHPSLAITLSNMAVAFDANNQYEEAFEYIIQAFDICCTSLGANHPQTQEIKIYFDQLRQKLPSDN